MSLLDVLGWQQQLATRVQSDTLTKGNFSGASNPITAPWIAMPDGGFPFNTPGVVNTPAISVTVWTDVINISVPNGFDGVIRKLVNSYNGGGFIEGAGSLVWRILRNGQAIRGYDGILISLGDNGTGDTQIRVGSGDTLQFQVTNASLGGGGTQVFCYFGGWYYPKKVS